jgi:hypothetical protein
MSGTDVTERLARDTAMLVREQLRRLSRDLTGSARQLEGGTVLLAAAGTCGLLATLAAHQTAVRALESLMPRPVATGVLAAGYAAGAATLAAAGVERVRKAAETADDVIDRVAESAASDQVGDGGLGNGS